VRLAFADHLRQLALLTNPIVSADGLRLSDAVVLHGWEAAKAKVPGVRVLLQRLGVSCREIFGDDCWVRLVESEMRPDIFTAHTSHFVITDVRFPNEADMIRDNGGVVVRIDRPDVKAINTHISEHALDDYEFDHYVWNDGTVDDLRTKLETELGIAT